MVLGVRHGVTVFGRVDERIAAVAGMQRGRISRRQLLQAGVSYRAIRRRIDRGYLRQLHPGVFAVGHSAPAALAAETAALLVVIPPAALSHGSAASLWGVMAAPDPVHIVVAAASAARLDGIRIHRTRALPGRDVQIRQGLPVTSPARTLLDRAETESEPHHRARLHELLVGRHLRVADLTELLARSNGRRGVGILRALVAQQSALRVSRSEAERRLLALLRAAQLPTPLTNAPLLGFEVDFLWPDHRFVLEFDSFQFHFTRRALERDRPKDAILIAAGYIPMRITWRELQDEPYAVVARIAETLGRTAL